MPRFPTWLRPQLTAGRLLLLVAVYLSTTQNLSFWREVLGSLPAQRGVQEWLFLGALFVAVNAALVFCLGVLTPRPLLRPVLSVLLLIAASCSYFMQNFHVIVDQAMLINVAQTDARESSELMIPAFWLHFGLLGVLPAALVWGVRIVSAGALREWLRRGVLLLAALATLGASVALRYKDFSLWARENSQVKSYLNPSYPVYSLARLVSHHFHKANTEMRIILPDATRRAYESRRPFVVVMVVGETARAANFQLHGYARATNPELAATQGLINLGPAESCGTSTAISVPCLFSGLGRSGFGVDRAATQQNALDVLARLGIDVLWRDNNSGCKGVCRRVPYEDLSNGPSPACKVDGCYDEVLLEGLEARMPKPGHSRLIVLHQKGSHGPAYYKRYPEAFRRFVPECRNDAVQTCSQQEIVNAYDNTLLYTDHVLATLIADLRAQQDRVDSVVLYVSDHGESLGEGGVYLHGLPYAIAPAEQKHVPFLAWFSSQALQRLGLDEACVHTAPPAPLSQDNLFDTLLGLFGVRAPDRAPVGDVFARCETVPR